MSVRPDPQPRQAIVLSGGGALGAFQVGVLKALLLEGVRGEDVDPKIFVGASVGSFNAAFLASHWKRRGRQAVVDLEKVWLHRLAGGFQDNGVFRPRVDPLAFLDPHALRDPPRLLRRVIGNGSFLLRHFVEEFVNDVVLGSGPIEKRFAEMIEIVSFISTRPLREAMLETIDFSSLVSSDIELRFSIVDWMTGRVKIASDKNFADVKTGIRLMEGAIAIPGIFPMVPFGRQILADGSVIENSPLNPAIDANADILHIVDVLPHDIDLIEVGNRRSLINVVYRLPMITWSHIINDRIREIAAHNDILTREADLARDRARTRTSRGELDRFREILNNIARHLRLPRRRLTLHRYLPDKDLGGSGFAALDFRRSRIEWLIEQGRRSVRCHDCSRCLVPDGSGRRQVREVTP